jgi:hypothetical protein
MLEAKGVVVRAPPECGGDLYILSSMPGMLINACPLYREIYELAVREPGILVSEIAARKGMPYDAALRTCKRMARLGLIELRKARLEYEVYPIALVS